MLYETKGSFLNCLQLTHKHPFVIRLKKVNGKEVVKMRHTVIVSMIHQLAEESRIAFSSFSLGVVKRADVMKVVDTVVRAHPNHSFGIGLSSHPPCLVKTIIKDSFATEADVCVGDEVVEVNGHWIEGLPIAEIISRIKASPPSGLRLVLRRRIDFITDEEGDEEGRIVEHQ
eukprot:m.9175 g.9175  ORF g.9175 m.9175 type:complete len:172 (+) comp6298_c0_seq2:729-1244(+)